MSKYSSDSNSRDRSRSYSRYYNQRRRSSSSSSSDSSRHRKSSKSSQRHFRKSKRQYKFNNSSESKSSRQRYFNRSYKKDESRSKKRHNSSSSVESDNSNSLHKNYTPKVSSLNEEKITSESSSNLRTSNNIKDSKVDCKDTAFDQIDKDIKHHNSIELIKQEGFVFKIFKPSVEQKDTDIDNFTSNLEEDVIKSLAVEKSTFFISSRERLLNVRYKLLTKKERSDIWAKYLFTSYKQSD